MLQADPLDEGVVEDVRPLEHGGGRQLAADGLGVTDDEYNV